MWVLKRYPGHHSAKGKCLPFPLTCVYSPSCLWGYLSSSPFGTSMGPIPSLTFLID